MSAHELVLVKLHRTGTSEWACPTCGHHQIRLIGLVWVRVAGDDVPHEVGPDPYRIGPVWGARPPTMGQLN